MDIFCQIKEKLNNQVIKETRNLYLMHDGYPLTEGHLLIIPKKHIRCFLELPEELQQEYKKLKMEADEFLTAYYQKPTIFEHGVVAQTVLHAHLHLLPTKKTILPQIKKIAERLATPKIPYLFYEENNAGEYYVPMVDIKAGFLHLNFAKMLKRPLNGLERAEQLRGWLLQVKEKFQEWQRKVLD